MTEFLELVSKINKQHSLVVDIRYSWRTGYDIEISEDGYDSPVIYASGNESVFDFAIEQLLNKYF